MFKCKQQTIFFILFFISGDILCSEDTNHTAVLKLFSGSASTRVLLPCPYYTPAETEDHTRTACVLEGQYTVLHNNKDAGYTKAIVGPLRPCQVCVLHNNVDPENPITIAVHMAASGDFKWLLASIKDKFPTVEWEKSVVTLLTTYLSTYDDPIIPTAKKNYLLSFKEIYQQRSQKEELTYNRNLVESILNIPGQNIKTLFFKPNLTAEQLGLYPSLTTFVLVKSDGAIYSTCPCNTNFPNLPKNLSLQEKVILFSLWLIRIKNKNPFFTQDKARELTEQLGYPPYATLPFLELT